MKELGTEEVCLALGYFDSVHLGHRKLIERARVLADKHGVKTCVATFSNNAYKLFNAEDKQVYTYSERCELLDGLCDFVLPMRFDTRLKNSSAQDFLDGLFERYAIKCVVCGYDYLFGAGAKGDADFLSDYCAKKGIECEVMPQFDLGGERVSTSRIKELLKVGDIVRANKMLSIPYRVTGKVVHGRGAGRMFDIPTANIKTPLGKLLPAFGVYATSCIIDGEEFFGATNVGPRPTFALTKSVVETMLCDFDRNIYDKTVTLCFHSFIRANKKFSTPAALSAQVHKDMRWHEHD